MFFAVWNNIKNIPKNPVIGQNMFNKWGGMQYGN